MSLPRQREAVSSKACPAFRLIFFNVILYLEKNVLRPCVGLQKDRETHTAISDAAKTHSFRLGQVPTSNKHRSMLAASVVRQ